MVAASVKRSAYRIATNYGQQSRGRKWRLYEQVFRPKPGERILDLGVSRLDDLQGENYFLRRYPYPEQITGVGISDLDELALRYPLVTFLQADGRDLPFANQSFDVVHSNAVIEHVGPLEDQARFVSEIVRVGKAGFVTTPSRWFPIEAHTQLPVVHWLPRRAMLATMSQLGITDGFPVWLLSRRRFRRLFPSDLNVGVVSQRVVGWTATITLLFAH